VYFTVTRAVAVIRMVFVFITGVVMNFETFRKEVQALLDLPYEFVQTRSSFDAVARKKYIGVAWSYDTLEKSYTFTEVNNDGLTRKVIQGKGKSLTEAFANKEEMPRL
jgi:hypothetical protein